MLGEKGLELLAPAIKQLPHLRFLNISNNLADEASLKFLLPMLASFLESLPALEMLNFQGNPRNVSDLRTLLSPRLQKTL
jgi:hypothetical protein